MVVTDMKPAKLTKLTFEYKGPYSTKEEAEEDARKAAQLYRDTIFRVFHTPRGWEVIQDLPPQ